MNGSHRHGHGLEAVTREVGDLRELEHAGESEWTPWLALAGLVLFLATVFLLVLGTVEAVSHLLN